MSAPFVESSHSWVVKEEAMIDPTTSELVCHVRRFTREF